MSDQRFITIVCAQPPMRVTALRGSSAPVPENASGGWTKVARPRRKALTQFNGRDPYECAVSLIIGYTTDGDGAAADRSCETDCQRLQAMLAPTDGSEPPLVSVIGAIPRPGLDYVIDSIDWDTDGVMVSKSGFRTRQPVTLHLLEYVADDRLQEAPAAERARRAALTKAATAAKASPGKQATKQKTYVVKAGDTLSAIAARLLGNAGRWTEIAALNGIRDPRRLAVGKTLRLP